MKITSLRITFATIVFATIVGLNNVYGGQTVFVNGREIANKGGGGRIFGTFPDVCKTPRPKESSPIPIPYPNMIPASASDFSTGKKGIKGGGKILIKGTKVRTKKGNVRALKVTVTNKAGKKVSLNKSKLFELADGTFCAVCVEDGLLTRIFSLRRVKKK